MDKERYEFCWIVDFPMYEIGEETGELEFCHNPFSMPNGGLEILEKAERGEVDPLRITAYPVRPGLQRRGARPPARCGTMTRRSWSRPLSWCASARRMSRPSSRPCTTPSTYGAPPHAGIAPGVDRMVMLLAGEDSIREIIPFPMNKNAQDVMMNAPTPVEQKQLDEVHIAIVAPEE